MEPRINDGIRAREVRLVGQDGQQIGIRLLSEALDMAMEAGLDLVEVADKANPPVCRIMDYGKYKYEVAQRAKESRRNSTNIVVKEMKYRPKIGSGDFDTKTRKVRNFLQEGYKVKVTIMFRGREVQHPELGRRILDGISTEVEDVAKVEVFPRLDGRNMVMVLGPGKKKSRKKASRSDNNAPPSEASPDAVASTEAETTPETEATSEAVASPETEATPEVVASPEAEASAEAVDADLQQAQD